MSTCDVSIQSRGAPEVRLGGAAGIGYGLRDAIARLFESLSAKAELRRRRRAFLNLATLDDRMLDDIGLTRSDVEKVAGLPLEINASLAVRQIAAARRAEEAWKRRRT